MGGDDWSNGYARALMVFYNGDAIPELDPRGEVTVDDSFLVIFNAHHEPVTFTIPAEAYGSEWSMCLDTNDPDGEEPRSFKPNAEVATAARSVVVLHRLRDTGE